MTLMFLGCGRTLEPPPPQKLSLHHQRSFLVSFLVFWVFEISFHDRRFKGFSFWRSDSSPHNISIWWVWWKNAACNAILAAPVKIATSVDQPVGPYLGGQAKTKLWYFVGVFLDFLVAVNCNTYLMFRLLSFWPFFPSHLCSHSLKPLFFLVYILDHGIMVFYVMISKSAKQTWLIHFNLFWCLCLKYIWGKMNIFTMFCHETTKWKYKFEKK